MHIERLVTMANDIAAFFNSAVDQEEAVQSIALHLQRYWDPRMRKQIIAHCMDGGAGLSQLALRGVKLLASESAPKV
jgi:formate dehydrogenase subunit delta